MQMSVIRNLLAALLLALAPSAHADVEQFDDPLVAARITRAINTLTERFPELQGVTVNSKQLDLDTYAEADGAKITFNSVYTSNARALERLIITDVQNGFHPALGYCTPEQLLTYHEAAHVIDVKKNRRPSEAVEKRYGNAIGLGLSGYSFSNGSLNAVEALAEAFAATLCNGGNEVEREMYEMLVK